MSGSRTESATSTSSWFSPRHGERLRASVRPSAWPPSPVPRLAMRRLLLVVVREEPRRYAYFKHTYSSDTVEVIVDRRVAERRNDERPVGSDRRRESRRR